MEWKRAWGYLPLDFSSAPVRASNEIQILHLPVNCSGSAVRVTVSNLYGTEPLVLDWIRLHGREGEPFLFAGNAAVCLQPGETRVSDPLAAEIRPTEDLTVAARFSGTGTMTTACSCCTPEAVRLEIIGADSGASVSPIRGMAEQDPRLIIFYGVCGIEVYTAEETRVLAAFGDSITHMSFFTAALQKRLMEEYPGQGNVINLGIGGNRILCDTPEEARVGRLFGEAGVRRFERDVFSAHADWVLVLEGINDLWHPTAFCLPEKEPEPRELEAGLQLYAGISRRHGAGILCGTILPFLGHESTTAEMDRKRAEINQWILSSGAFDATADYSGALADPRDAGCLQEIYDSGDHVHPGREGGSRMASCVPLETLMGSRRN